MTNAINSRKNWIRKFCSLLIGLVVAGAIVYILPKLPKKKKEPVKIESIEKVDIDTDVKKKAFGLFKRYKVIINVRYKEGTEVEKSVQKIRKGCSFIEVDDLIEKITLIEVKGLRKKEDVDVEYDVELDTE